MLQNMLHVSCSVFPYLLLYSHHLHACPAFSMGIKVCVYALDSLNTPILLPLIILSRKFHIPGTFGVVSFEFIFVYQGDYYIYGF